MMSVPFEALDLTEDLLWRFVAIFLRVGAIVSMLPGFGERTVPTRIKLVVALSFAVIVTPAIPDFLPPTGLGQVVLFIGSETVIGLALGIGLRLFVLCLQTAGTIAAQSTSLAQILGGAAVDPIPAMGYILTLGGVTLAVILGLHVKAAQLMILSYEIFPPGRFPDGHAISAWGVTQIARAFSLAFVLAAPFVIASLLYNLALGAINRAMPQLMVAFVGAPAITLGGLVILMISAPIMLAVWSDALTAYAADPMRVLP